MGVAPDALKIDNGCIQNGVSVACSTDMKATKRKISCVEDKKSERLIGISSICGPENSDCINLYQENRGIQGNVRFSVAGPSKEFGKWTVQLEEGIVSSSVDVPGCR